MTKARVNADNASADIQGVTAGTGLTGGGTSGTVTVTNSMATAIDAKGDLVAGTGADAFARIAVGANGTVLQANSATATGLEWVAPTSPAFVGAYAFKSAGQAISSGSNTLQTFDSESFDSDGFHSTTTNTARMTIPSGQAGKYVIVGHSGLGNATQTGAPCWIWLEKNGSLIAFNSQIMINSGMANRFGIVTIADLAVGDFVTMSVYYSDASTGQETPSGVTGTFLSIAKL